MTDARPVPVRYALPLPAGAVTPANLRAPHHDYPASDLVVPTGTPVLAAAAGSALVVRGGKCGIGVVITGNDGYRYVNCHLSAAAVGRWVEAGDVVGLSGDSGNAKGTAPHLHFDIRNVRGAHVCPQPLLVAWASGRQLPPASAETTTGCFFVPRR